MIQAVSNLKVYVPPVFLWKWWGNSAQYEDNSLTQAQVKEFIENVVKQRDKNIDVVSFAKALNFKEVDQKPLFEQIALSAEMAKFYAPLKKNSWDCTARISAWVNTFFVALERFLTKLGLIHLFKPIVSPEQADAKGQDMILLSTLFSTMTSTLVPLLGPLHGGMIIGGCMLTLLGLSLAYPFWRPFPSCLPQVENWSEENKKEPFSSTQRKELLDKVVGALNTSEIDHLQPLLVGKLGVGKTELVKALTVAIEQGQYPDLEGYQVFYMNTANLHSPTGWVPKAHSSLSYFNEAIEGKRDKMIFVFDQIHMACEVTCQAFIADQFNTLLDFPKKHFPHVIGITTPDEYAKFLKSNPSFAERFLPITVAETTEAETIEILTRARLKHAPDTLVIPSMESILFKKVKEAFGQEAVMPKRALQILAKCIQKCSKNQSPKETALFVARSDLMRLKQGQIALAKKIGTNPEELEQKTFLVLSSMLIPALEEKLLSNAKEKGIKLQIDEEMIDLCIREVKSN